MNPPLLNETAEVIVDVLLVREEGSKVSKIIGKLKKGDLVAVNGASSLTPDEIDGKKDYWYSIFTTSNIEGYVFGGYIQKANVPCLPLKPESFKIEFKQGCLGDGCKGNCDRTKTRTIFSSNGSAELFNDCHHAPLYIGKWKIVENSIISSQLLCFDPCLDGNDSMCNPDSFEKKENDYKECVKNISIPKYGKAEISFQREDKFTYNGGIFYHTYKLDEIDPVKGKEKYDTGLKGDLGNPSAVGCMYKIYKWGAK